MVSTLPRKVALLATSLSLAVGAYTAWQFALLGNQVEHIFHSKRQPASTAPSQLQTRIASNGAILVSLDEVVVNLGSQKYDQTATLSFKIEIELFEESSRPFIEQNLASIRNAIIDASHRETIEKLNTLSGKLYFKETLVSRTNDTLNQPIVRDIHFASFLVR